MALMYASERLRKDRDLVLLAVKQYGAALEFAPMGLRRDHEVVLEAVARSGEALLCAPREMRNSRCFMLEAVRRNGQALNHASPALRCNRELIKAACSQKSKHLDEVLACAGGHAQHGHGQGGQGRDRVAKPAMGCRVVGEAALMSEELAALRRLRPSSAAIGSHVRANLRGASGPARPSSSGPSWRPGSAPLGPHSRANLQGATSTVRPSSSGLSRRPAPAEPASTPYRVQAFADLLTPDCRYGASCAAERTCMEFELKRCRPTDQPKVVHFGPVDFLGG
mmetsp:Transcript_115671/g.338325  ORF Transcript_115671/g.338325 Transcript_115671/m.338325 type:complete len:281 (+) Transcript_115671:205-1047(+)